MKTLDATAAADLVSRIVAGQEAAEAELVERCGQVLRFLARRYSRTDADAEDLYQETLILGLEKIRRQEVRQPEHLASFLRSLIKNLSIQKYRRRSYAAETPAGESSDTIDEGQPDPLRGLLHRERVQLTRRLLDELNVPRDREVLFRYYLAEHDSRSICSDLNIDSDHFYRVLHRARQRYRQLWEQRARHA